MCELKHVFNYPKMMKLSYHSFRAKSESYAGQMTGWLSGQFASLPMKARLVQDMCP